jgi:hypothetical protein
MECGHPAPKHVLLEQTIEINKDSDGIGASSSKACLMECGPPPPKDVPIPLESLMISNRNAIIHGL